VTAHHQTISLKPFAAIIARRGCRGAAAMPERRRLGGMAGAALLGSRALHWQRLCGNAVSSG